MALAKFSVGLALLVATLPGIPQPVPAQQSGICAWDLTTGKQSRRLFPVDRESAGGSYGTFSAACTLYAVRTAEGMLGLFDVAAGKVLHELAHESDPCLWEFSEDGRLLACMTKSHLYVWDVATRRRLRQWPVTGPSGRPL